MEDAVAHSLRKWRGLTGHNLAEHGLLISRRMDIMDQESRHVFPVSSASCALCHHYYRPNGVEHEDRCKQCPLAKARNDTPCDSLMPGEKNSPWGMWFQYQNPLPMIRLLREAMLSSVPQLTIKDVLVQAANTAGLTGSYSPSAFWEFAFSTARADDDDDSPGFAISELEEAFDNAVLGAKSYGMSVPQYVLEVMYPNEE